MSNKKNIIFSAYNSNDGIGDGVHLINFVSYFKRNNKNLNIDFIMILVIQEDENNSLSKTLLQKCIDNKIIDDNYSIKKAKKVFILTVEEVYSITKYKLLEINNIILCLNISFYNDTLINFNKSLFYDLYNKEKIVVINEIAGRFDSNLCSFKEFHNGRPLKTFRMGFINKCGVGLPIEFKDNKQNKIELIKNIQN
jgi:hypothetical protein